MKVQLNDILPDVDLNVELPNGTYAFEPTVQEHVDCIKKLIQVIELHGALCFQHVVLDGVGQPVTHGELLQLFESFHESEATAMKVKAITRYILRSSLQTLGGEDSSELCALASLGDECQNYSLVLQVVIRSERVPPPHAPQLHSNLFSTLLKTLSGPCSDQLRLQMLQTLQNTAAISCSQAAAILGCFETQDVSQALQILLMSIHDVLNIPTFEHVAMECVNACGNSALDDAYEQLRCPSAISLTHNPSGHYELDLTNQVCTLCHTDCDCCKHWTALSIGHPHATNITIWIQILIQGCNSVCVG